MLMSPQVFCGLHFFFKLAVSYFWFILSKLTNVFDLFHNNVISSKEMNMVFLSWKCGGHLYTFNILQWICFLIARILAWAVKVIAFGIFFCFSVQVLTASITFSRGLRNSVFFLNHISSHGSGLGSNPLLIFSTILTIACVSLSLCRIFDIWIIEQILQKKQKWISIYD